MLKKNETVTRKMFEPADLNIFIGSINRDGFV